MVGALLACSRRMTVSTGRSYISVCFARKRLRTCMNVRFSRTFINRDSAQRECEAEVRCVATLTR
jgi:hypothetical protein